MIKQKKCSGQGLAKGFGCGKLTNVQNRVYGLGKMCGCYSDWLLNSENGKIKLQKSIIQVSKPRLEMEKAKSDQTERKTIGNLLINVRTIVHQYIRKRDERLPCISCGNQWHADFQAGHFYKSELYSTLRFNELNISGQCQRCNLFNNGNESGYRVGFINRYGKDKLAELDLLAEQEKKGSHKWSREDLIEIRNHYKKLITQL